MSTPFTSVESLTYPPDDGKAAVERSNTVSSSYDEKQEGDLVLEGSGSHDVSFGTIDTDGAKAIQIEMDATNTAPVMVQVNGGGATGQVEVSPGGCWKLTSPSPSAAGVLAITLVHTVDSKVKVRILG